ncbi:DUF397 domain-containing protein [Streptomyces sp. NPDC046805]|uniref:DUF397 domain-containing protein n=1 Tax=Streptomyces sp. NPDC046805 TaxID=3155134 RepID=UPI0033EE7D09
MDQTDPLWRKSSYSMGNGGNCVEVADGERSTRVRDSKDPGGPVLAFGRAPWRRFVTALGRDATED